MHLLVLLVALLAAVIGGARNHSASADIPEGALDARLAGYPDVLIRITDMDIEAPETAPAGRVLLIQRNDSQTDAHFFILRVPDEVTEAQVAADLATEAIPDWFYQSRFVGNPDRAAPGGGQVYGLVDLSPGRYLVMDPLSLGKFDRFDVGGQTTDPVEATTDPADDVVVELFEMGFTMPDTVESGRQLWRIDNGGAAIHEIALMPIPAGATSEDALEALGALYDGQPIPQDLGATWADWEFSLVNGVGVTSPGVSAWAQFDLEPGRYVALCFIPGANDVPHLMNGMAQTLTVIPDSTASTPTA